MTIDRPHLLAPGGAERHRPHPAGPRVPARAGRRGQGEGAQQPDHRPAAGLRRGGAAHRGLGLLGHRHDQPGPRLPQRQRQQRTAADHAGGGGPVRQLRCTRGAATGTSSSRPSRRTTTRSTSSSASSRATRTPTRAARLPSPSSVTVSVLNGSGAYNQATDTAQSLQALGFHIGTIGDSPPVGREAETVVYYSSKTPAELAAAQAVANSMSGAVIMAKDPTQVKPGSQVTVVTGTDFTRQRAAGHRRHPTSAVRRAPPATEHDDDHVGASSGNTGNSGRLPRADTDRRTLQPWDPRSCTASGGEGPEPPELEPTGSASGEDLAAVGVERLPGHGATTGPRRGRRSIRRRPRRSGSGPSGTRAFSSSTTTCGRHAPAGRRHLDVDVDRRARPSSRARRR